MLSRKAVKKEIKALGVTIKQVAEEAGVSRNTVSNFLNRRFDTGEDTLKKISEALVQIRYKKGQAA
ncbi:helix-turn-helix domain-containing protein [Deinococcus cellulosilyticus]|uniref:HTH cro/C1-type domain-containing protein n=1 Tax=Deinococcus cellulosilyticus (strain DSM 18568 / NBRC 106333 / KACC 11606 / 5516J-15) TaxID=1223518 RepID=A0A511MZA3_DEIC1|nr:helix-turn-helix domain-containing protein [Deinococcus cellulosilyticus]GEM45872.1 hypothetical protein DC3_15070 [Deinococcus cellulosilyticus NBRC 106333 = KACC 11606]